MPVLWGGGDTLTLMITPPSRPRGITLGGYLTLIGVGVAASCLGRVVTAGSNGQYQDQGFGRLSVALLLEALSWAVYPIVMWLLVAWLRRNPTPSRRGQTFGILALLALVSEVPYDFVTAGAWASGDSQNPVWALVVTLVVHEATIRFGEHGQRGRVLIAAVVVSAVLWLVIFNVGMRLGIAPFGLVMLSFYGIFVLLWSRENTMMLSAGALGAVTFLTPALGVAIMHYRQESLADQAPFPSPWWASLYPLGMGVTALLAGLLG